MKCHIKHAMVAVCFVKQLGLELFAPGIKSQSLRSKGNKSMYHTHGYKVIFASFLTSDFEGHCLIVYCREDHQAYSENSESTFVLHSDSFFMFLL